MSAERWCQQNTADPFRVEVEKPDSWSSQWYKLDAKGNRKPMWRYWSPSKGDLHGTLASALRAQREAVREHLDRCEKNAAKARAKLAKVDARIEAKS